MATQGGPAQPVSVVTSVPVEGGAAIPVAVVTDGRATLGGPAIPVYVVSGSFSPAPTPLPLIVSGLQLWYAARLMSGIDGAAIVPTDFSGNGRDATQATGTKQPLFKTNIINGKPVFRFDGTDDFLNVPAIDLTGTNGLTLFAVVANITSGSDRVIFECSTNINSFTDGFLLYRESGNSMVAALRGNAGASGSNFISTVSVTSAATVVSATYDKSLATNEVTNWLNGTSAGTRGANVNNTNNFGNRASFIGMRAGTTLPLAGDIAEILLYNRVLTTAERQQIEAYLS